MASKIFIDGEAGTTGLQIRDRLAARSDIELLSIDADKRKDLDARRDLLNVADIAILCLPDDAARQSVSLIENTATRVIDASTAHRVHPDWAYGFAEMSVDQTAAIAAARFVANPGCWPQGVIAAMRPLVESGLSEIADTPVFVTGVSGYSGGGKSMIADYETAGDQANTFMPYGLQFAHKHLPEMKAYSGSHHAPHFVPAVGNYYQGMLEIIRIPQLHGVPKAADIHARLEAHFSALADSFVSVMPFEQTNRSDELNPELLNGTNQMHLHVFGDINGEQAIVVAVYDNLGKGASGAAVQNLNLMIGADPKTGL